MFECVLLKACPMFFNKTESVGEVFRQKWQLTSNGMLLDQLVDLIDSFMSVLWQSYMRASAIWNVKQLGSPASRLNNLEASMMECIDRWWRIEVLLQSWDNVDVLTCEWPSFCRTAWSCVLFNMSPRKMSIYKSLLSCVSSGLPTSKLSSWLEKHMAFSLPTKNWLFIKKGHCDIPLEWVMVKLASAWTIFLSFFDLEFSWYKKFLQLLQNWLWEASCQALPPKSVLRHL